MFVLLFFLAWISGIATMGMHVPETLISLAPTIYFLAFIFIILSLLRKLNFLNLASLNPIIFRCLSGFIILLATFLMAQHYADNALQKRLDARFKAVEYKELTVYVEKISEFNHRDGREGFKQIAQVMDASTRQNKNILLYIDQNKLNESTDTQIKQKQLKLGSYYKVSGQLKPAHSYAIPHVFDQEKWLIQQNIMGVMQVKAITPLMNHQLQVEGLKHTARNNQGLLHKIQIYAETKRLEFRAFITSLSVDHKGLLLALLTGDESLLSDHIKDQFKTLGISHLLAISGPHVLIFAVIFSYLFNLIVTKTYPKIFLKLARPYLLLLPFLLCVILYTAFVGFEIPAMRTCLTVMVISLAIAFKQQINPLKLLLFSAAILLLIDPFSILSAAFWLSYGACFILIRVYQTMLIKKGDEQINDDSNGIKSEYLEKVKRFLSVLVDSQWKIFIALFPLVAIIFQQVSWVSPLVNLIAVPIIGLIVVPLEVVGACISLIFQPLGSIFFHLADWVLSGLLFILKLIEGLFNPRLTWLSLTVVEIALVGLGIFILFLPQRILPKLWVVICFVPIFLPNKDQHSFNLNILDIGQGQAIHLNTGQQNFMFDVGGYYDESKFSVGKQLILPYLMGEGIDQLDSIYLTHLDQDHSGAYQAIAQEILIQKVISNEKSVDFKQTDFEYCHQGQSRQIGKVKLSVLMPSQKDLKYVKDNKNEFSCVIYIQVPYAKGFQNFLIMGDAGWQTEYQLLKEYPDLKVDVLVLGHHGSQHSSSYDFLKNIKPKLAIASAGFNNRYQHPHPTTIARMESLDIPFLSTIDAGSIQFYISNDGEMKVNQYRDSKRWLKD